MLRKRKFTRSTFGIALSLSLGLISCSREDLSAESVAEGIWYNCLTREFWTSEKEVWCAKRILLRNTTYQISDLGLIALTDGVYENPDERLSIILVDEPGSIVYGDLADSINVALTLLRANSGGMGIFFYLAALVDEGDNFDHLATVLLGDRVIVQSVALEAGLIKVNLIKQGPDDPQLGPTLELLQTYELQGEELKLLSEQEIGVANQTSEDNQFNAD